MELDREELLPETLPEVVLGGMSKGRQVGISRCPFASGGVGYKAQACCGKSTRQSPSPNSAQRRSWKDNCAGFPAAKHGHRRGRCSRITSLIWKLAALRRPVGRNPVPNIPYNWTPLSSSLRTRRDPVLRGTAQRTMQLLHALRSSARFGWVLFALGNGLCRFSASVVVPRVSRDFRAICSRLALSNFLIWGAPRGEFFFSFSWTTTTEWTNSTCWRRAWWS